MREARARGPSIDITELERRLRGSEPSRKRDADPLRELARLLQSEDPAQAADPYRRIFSQSPRARARQEPAAAPMPQPPAQDSYDNFFAADLRGSLAPSAPTSESAPFFHHQAAGEEFSYQDQDFLDYGVDGDEQEQAAAEAPPRGAFAFIRSKIKPWGAVAGIAALGAVSIAWGFAHRESAVGPREVATINAPQGPAKVQPSASADSGAAQQGAAVLDRSESAPVKQVVSHEEQPIDPTTAPRILRLGDGPVDAPHEPSARAASAGGSLMPEPKKVKTVSVRPDGTIIENDAVPAAITRPALPPLRATALDGKQGGAPDDTVTPRSAAKPPTTPTPRAEPSPRVKPEKVAAAVENPQPDDSAPAASGAASGVFAVQFSAADSEAEARRLMLDVAAKYKSHLGGRRLGYRRAKVGDKVVYRVRIAGVSKESAVAICEKVKSAGGNCFVAGN